MALDEPTKNDEKFQFDRFEFIVNKTLLKKVQPIKVDFLTHGFKLDCNMNFDSGCTSCSTSGSCNS